MNWFGKKKKENEQKTAELNKTNLDSFLKDVKASIEKSFYGGESLVLEKAFQKEVDNWIQTTVNKGKNLNQDAVKLGICLGIKEVLRIINEAEKETKKPVYIR